MAGAKAAPALMLMRALVVAGAYYALARLALQMAFEHSNVTPVWPPSGIAVGALILLGLRFWPVLLASAFLVNVTTGLSPVVSAGLAMGNTIEYALAAMLLHRLGFDIRLRNVRDVVVFVLAAGLAGPLAAATIGTASLWAGGVIPRAAIATVWAVYLVGDGVGILVVTPFVLMWRRPAFAIDLARQTVIEMSLLGAGVVGLCAAIFVGPVNRPYLIFPLAIWASVRFGQKGATATVVVVSSFAVWGTVHGIGPFNAGPVTERLADLQIYLAAFAFTALSLGAAIGALRDSEAEVSARTRELESTNRELEAFAYTVAHDLRAPLRAIGGFAKALVQDGPSSLSADMHHQLDRINVNAVAMGRLIDALLDFARLGPRRLSRQTVEPKRLAELALEQLLSGAPQRGREITVCDLPVCSADPDLLALVFQNLLDNALKFTQIRELPKIEVGWMPGTSQYDPPVYFIRDNGAGFDMRYIDKLFGVFVRLHRQVQFPGTGAGLAIVKRIVNKHGGRIWAQAEKDVGATFFFTLAERR